MILSNWMPQEMHPFNLVNYDPILQECIELYVFLHILHLKLHLQWGYFVLSRHSSGTKKRKFCLTYLYEQTLVSWYCSNLLCQINLIDKIYCLSFSCFVPWFSSDVYLPFCVFSIKGTSITYICHEKFEKVRNAEQGGGKNWNYTCLYIFLTLFFTSTNLCFLQLYQHIVLPKRMQTPLSTCFINCMLYVWCMYLFYNHTFCFIFS